MGKKNFDKLFKSEDKLFHMRISPEGITKGHESIGLDLESKNRFDSGDESQRLAIQEANNADVGTIFSISADDPSAVNKEYEQEYFIKVDNDLYAAFPLTSGDAPRFYTMDELKKNTSEMGSKDKNNLVNFHISKIQKMNYDIEK
jgi:hypothetical protein